MIWALLFSIIFSNSSKNVFINEGLKKQVKKHVENKEIKKDILVQVRALEKKGKALRKKEKKLGKELSKLNSNRDATRGDFDELFEKYFKIYEDFHLASLEARLDVKDKLTQEEWNHIVEEADQDYAKWKKKKEKKIARFKRKMEKKESRALSIIRDEQKRNEAHEAIRNFKLKIIEIQSGINQFNYTENEVLKSRNSSREELEQLYHSMEELEMSAIQAFEDLHFQLMSLTTEEEFRKIQKSINKII